MARSDARDLRDVILLSSSPVLPPQRPLASSPKGVSSLASVDRPAWRGEHLMGSNAAGAAGDSVVLGSASDVDVNALADGQPRPSQAYSKFFDDNDDEASLPAIKPDRIVENPKPEAYKTGDLELAVQRRRDWTPPPLDTVVAALGSGSPRNAEDWSSSPGDRADRRSNVFKSLKTDFGCKIDDAATPATISRESSFTKRKAIEAISIGDNGRNTTPVKKAKAPKKKLRTLTELAVAAYADAPPPAEGDDDDTTTTTMTTKQQLDVIDDSAPLAPVEVRQGFPTSKLRKLKPSTTAATAGGAKKSKPRATTKRAPAARKQVVLSPASARVASNAQDFLFGTSSQLASEHSPTFLRHLHTAMQESNRSFSGNHDYQSDEDTGRNRLLDILAKMSSEADISTVDLTGQQQTSASGDKDGKRLWGAAARGADGHLSFDNVIDLEDAIVFPEDPHQVIAMAQRAAAEAIQKEAPEAATPAEIQVTTQKSTQKSTAKSTAKSTPKSTQKPRATQSGQGKGKQPALASSTQADAVMLPTPAQTAPPPPLPSATAPSATAPSATAPSATAPSATAPSATAPSATAPSAT
ncbi:MAG: 5'-flap endonuclease, partial [Sporothrix thermara]